MSRRGPGNTGGGTNTSGAGSGGSPEASNSGQSPSRTRRTQTGDNSSVRALHDTADSLATEGQRADVRGGQTNRQPPRRDSRGREIPDSVQRLPSGRLPANWHYAGRVYDGEHWTPDLAQRYPDGVRFSNDGFPDFSPYATHTVTFDPQYAGNTTTDFTQANRLAGLPRTPDDYTWHHHQDTRTMQLVPTEVHDAVRHAGGRAILR